MDVSSPGLFSLILIFHCCTVTCTAREVNQFRTMEFVERIDCELIFLVFSNWSPSSSKEAVEMNFLSGQW